MTTLYPLVIEPKEVPLIWGGDALVRQFGKRGDPGVAIGESWECWDENLIMNGAFAGKRIADLRAAFGRELMGDLDPTQIFPILTKLIDARQSLSVQVHPDDAYAQRVEGQRNGKTECWYILDARPDAELVLGWNRDTSRDEYLACVQDGTLGKLLRRVAVRPGDVFYLPAGTLHAIGAGIILFETQQASDLTYRIFDWNRLGADGKPRLLHIEKAADVLDYHESKASALHALTYTIEGLDRALLVADPRFVMERTNVTGQARTIDLETMPLIVMALDRPVYLEANGTTVALAPYATALVPAAVARVIVRAANAAATVLTAAPPRDAHAVRERLSRAGVSAVAIEAFMRQFAPVGRPLTAKA